MEEIMKQSKLDRILSYIAWAVIVGFILLLVVTDTEADTNQTTTSGSNTAIDGGYTSTTTNNYSAATAVDQSSTSNTTSNIKSAPPTASSPPLTSGIDTCAMSLSMGMQTFNFGVSGGTTYVDEHCQMLKNVKILNDVGMKVAAIALLCNSSEKIAFAMSSAGTICPVNVNGKSLLGDKALAVYEKYPKLRPDYNLWKEQQDIISEYKANEVMFESGR